MSTSINKAPRIIPILNNTRENAFEKLEKGKYTIGGDLLTGRGSFTEVTNLLGASLGLPKNRGGDPQKADEYATGDHEFVSGRLEGSFEVGANGEVSNLSIVVRATARDFVTVFASDPATGRGLKDLVQAETVDVTYTLNAASELHNGLSFYQLSSQNPTAVESVRATREPQNVADLSFTVDKTNNFIGDQAQVQGDLIVASTGVGLPLITIVPQENRAFVSLPARHNVVRGSSSYQVEMEASTLTATRIGVFGLVVTRAE